MFTIRTRIILVMPILDSFSISMNLSLFGIGAELRSEDGLLQRETVASGWTRSEEQQD
jgi:hypothetical protein